MPALFRSRGKAYDLLGEFLSARDDYVRAVAFAHEEGDLSSEWQSLLDLGFLHSGRDYAQADHYLQRALALARQLDDPTALGHTLNRLGNWQLMAGDPEEGARCHYEALAIFQAAGDKRNLAATYDLLGTMFMLTADSVAAAQNYEQAIPLLREVDDRWTLSSALAMQACSGGHLICEAIINQPLPLPACLRMGDEAMTLARQLDAPPAEAFACIQHAIAAAAHGEYARALRAGERALAIASEQESAQFLAGATRALGSLHFVFLDYAHARRVFEQGLPAARTTGSSLLLGAVSGGLAETLIAMGELDQARVLLDSIALNDATLRQIGERTAWSARAELYYAAGDIQAALELVERLIDAAPNVAQGGVIPRLWQLRAGCLISFARFDAAELLLRRASHTAQMETLLPRWWRIELDLGKLRHQQGDAQRAQVHYDAARAVIETLALKIGDTPAREQFLARAGVLIPKTSPPTPAQLQKAAFGGLTKREREVAALIARGRTNRAIADALVLSERTVEKHVENVMGKLGFAVRAQVAVWAVEKGLLT